MRAGIPCSRQMEIRPSMRCRGLPLANSLLAWLEVVIFFHAYQFQAEVAKSVKDAVKVGLIMDLADEGALFVAWFHGKPLECGRKVSGEAPPDCDPVPGRLHVTFGVLQVGAHLEPKPDER